MTDFPRLLAALHDAAVRFIVVGGAAATAHGSARLTLDLDVVYERSGTSSGWSRRSHRTIRIFVVLHLGYRSISTPTPFNGV